jgi:hypothetical protein
MLKYLCCFLGMYMWVIAAQPVLALNSADPSQLVSTAKDAIGGIMLAGILFSGFLGSSQLGLVYSGRMKPSFNILLGPLVCEVTVVVTAWMLEQWTTLLAIDGFLALTMFCYFLYRVVLVKTFN